MYMYSVNKLEKYDGFGKECGYTTRQHPGPRTNKADAFTAAATMNCL